MITIGENNNQVKSAEEFVKEHFKGIEKETWYPAIVSIAEGYGKYLIEQHEKRIGETNKEKTGV